MTKYRVWGAVALVVGFLLAYFVWSTESGPQSSYRFKLGLDLAGGTELVYKADLSQTPAADQTSALSQLQSVIERRINPNGVGEYIVELERAGAFSGITEDRLIVALPGVYDINQATSTIGSTPTLEFKLAQITGTGAAATTTFVSTGLTGKYLETASVAFGSGTGAGLARPLVQLQFNSEGAQLFEKITSENIGQVLAIFLDEQVISAPIIQSAIPGGTAVITGDFSTGEARELADSLKFGALPVPITLQSSSTVGPTLGAAAIEAGVVAGVVGFAIVALFMVLWYRLPGVIAVVALAEYVAFMLAAIKAVPITLTASGIAALIISVGMAVDANVLIFERTKEELRAGKGPREAVQAGFKRAWPAIRDGHFTMIMSGLILFWLGTGLVRGFSVVFVLGVLASFISAVSLSRVFLLAIVPEAHSKKWNWLLSSGFRSSTDYQLPPTN